MANDTSGHDQGPAREVRLPSLALAMQVSEARNVVRSIKGTGASLNMGALCQSPWHKTGGTHATSMVAHQKFEHQMESTRVIAWLNCISLGSGSPLKRQDFRIGSYLTGSSLLPYHPRDPFAVPGWVGQEFYIGESQFLQPVSNASG